MACGISTVIQGGIGVSAPMGGQQKDKLQVSSCGGNSSRNAGDADDTAHCFSFQHCAGSC